MTKKICAYCGKAFPVDENRGSDKQKKYCSFDCYDSMNNKRFYQKKKREKAGEVVLLDKYCEYCGKLFKAAKGPTKYCGKECRDKASNENRKAYGAEYRKRKKQEKLQEEESKKHDNLHEANAKARAFAKGMSYGKYYAMLYAQEQMHDAKKRR